MLCRLQLLPDCIFSIRSCSMRSFVDSEARLTLSQKAARLCSRLQNPEWRRYGALLLVGKTTGMAVVLLLIGFVSQLCFAHVFAADAPGIKAADVINPLNTIWTLIAAFLVFGMQVGFTMLEAGFCRSRETVNVLVECV